MQLETLKFFVDAVRLHSFSRAAEANGVTQSAVSQAIQQLEQRLGVRLVDRSRRPWVVTPEGRLYYERCRELLEGLEEIEARIRQMGREGAYNVDVAAIYSVGLHDMSRYEAALTEEFPHATVRFDYLHPHKVLERVLVGEADVGLLSFPPNQRELVVVPWRDEEMVLVCRPDSRWAKRRVIEPAELDGETLVAFEEGLAIRKAIDRYLRKHHARCEPVGGFDNVEMIKRAVEEGMGVAILPEPTLRRELERGSLVAVRFRGERFVRPLCAVVRKRRHYSPALIRFVEILTGRPWGAVRRSAAYAGTS